MFNFVLFADRQTTEARATMIEQGICQVQGTEAEVDRESGVLFDQHGSTAVYIALDRLNESIDRGDRAARDFWVLVVRAIHERQRSASRPDENSRVDR
jgi:hypothetical protein